MPDLYSTLGVGKDATPAAVHAAYRKAARKAHPDGGGSKEKFADLVLARDVLSDEARREHYDRTGRIEDAPIDQTEANAMNLVMEAVNFVWLQCENRRLDVATVDVVRDATIYVEKKLNSVEDNRREGLSQAEKLRKFAARFKTKKSVPNRIRDMVKARADELERSARSLEATIAAMKRALDILDVHDYDWSRDEAKAPLPLFGSYIHFSQ